MYILLYENWKNVTMGTIGRSFEEFVDKNVDRPQ